MVLRALLIDDEYPARQELRYLLGHFPEVEIVGEAAGATEALQLIKAVAYDILFLDISLPGINGLELTASLQKLPKPPQVVFITAYDNYAVHAFEVNAAGYLLKPVEMASLKRVIAKVAGQVREKGRELSKENSTPAGREELLTSKIVAVSGEKTVLVDVNDIHVAYLQGERVLLKTFAETMNTRFTLQELAGRVQREKFFCSRNYIVNLCKVQELLPFFKGSYILVLGDKARSELRISGNEARILRQLLGL